MAYILQEHGLGFTIRTGVQKRGIALQNFAGVENISCAGTLLCSGQHTLFTQFQLHVTWHIECSYYFAKQKWQNYEKFKNALNTVALSTEGTLRDHKVNEDKGKSNPQDTGRLD